MIILTVFGQNIRPNQRGFTVSVGTSFDQCCTIIARGQELDDRTVLLARQRREKPLAKNDENRYEVWWDFIEPFAGWCHQHEIEVIATQLHVIHPLELVQGTLDIKWIVDGVLRIDDFKAAVQVPYGTRFQTAFYDLADRNMTGRSAPAKRHAIQLQPGKCTFHPYTDYRDFETCRLISRTYQRSRQWS